MPNPHGYLGHAATMAVHATIKPLVSLHREETEGKRQSRLRKFIKRESGTKAQAQRYRD